MTLRPVEERTGKIRQEFLAAQVGKTEEVLIESEIHDGMMQGYTKIYTPVVIPAVKSLLCTVQEVVTPESRHMPSDKRRTSQPVHRPCVVPSAFTSTQPSGAVKT